MTTITIKKAKGYRGKMRERSYVALLEGLDETYGFKRDFLDADRVDWGDSKLYKKSRGTWTEEYDLSDGLYEVQEWGDRKYLAVAGDNAEEITIDEAQKRLRS